MKHMWQIIGLAIMMVLTLPMCLHAQDDTIRTFSREHPLIYEDARDLFPYSFLNDHGEAEGFNVELVRLLMEELNIPYIIRLKERRTVLQDLKSGEADLTMGMDALFHNEYGHYGKTVIQLFTHSVVTPKSQPISVRTLQDLRHQQVIVHRNSFSHHLMEDNGWGQNALPYDDMKAAVLKVSQEEAGQIVWNTASLKWLLQECNIDNLQLTAINMPHGEYKFISKDQKLLQQIDDAYTALYSDNRLEALQTKWFYPERTETGLPSWIWYLTGTAAAIALILVYINVNYRTRERKAIELVRQRNSRLSLVLQACHVRIWTYDIDKQLFTWMDRNGQPQRQYTGLEFARMYHPEDFRRLGEGIRQLASGTKDKVELELKSRYIDSDDDEEYEFLIVLSVLRKENGRPTVIIGTKSDITEEREKQREAHEQLLRYQSVFNTAMVDMAYYDEKGTVVDVNERCCQTFGMGPEGIKANGITIGTTIHDDHFDLANLDYFYATVFLQSSDFKSTDSPKQQSTMYYEWQLVPVRDREGQLIGCYGTGRDVSEVVRTYRQLQEGILKLQKATKEVTDYVDNINYVLGTGGIRMANYSPDTHTLTIYKGLNTIQQALTQSRCMTLVDEKSKKAAMRTLNNMDNRTGNTIDMEIKTAIRLKGMPLYLNFRFIPIRNEAGQVETYFGMCRDLSEIKATEAMLEKETAKAQGLEVLKNSFLRNMSYEIRTPLTTVVGFAELFEMDHDVADEEIFIREIKDSSAHLLHLINDILFLSRLDAHMIEINKQPIDFAQTFEGHCQIGWANDMRDGVNYIVENPYEQLVVDIDDSNMSRIIEQIIQNAAQHTEHGTVRARYDYIGGKLMIAIDDTGCGMSKYTLEHIYERFGSANHQGTGLGVPICKELAEQMGGTIDISSEEGKGTTVWITMPCKATVMERKKQL